MRDSIDSKIRFIWRVTASHVIAYAFAGIFALLVMNYAHLYSVQPLSCFMRPVDSPIVALGPALQLVRGIIIALVLWFFRKTFLQDKFGFLKLALLVFGLSYVSTIGPSPGSFESFIYTTFPVEFGYIWLPETIIYAGLFSCSLFFWYKLEKKVMTVVSIIIVAAFLLANTASFLSLSKIIG